MTGPTLPTGQAAAAGGSTLEKKAALVAIGKVRLSEGTRLPVFPLRDTTGPDAGLPSLFLAFEGTRVRVALEEGDGEVDREGNAVAARDAVRDEAGDAAGDTTDGGDADGGTSTPFVLDKHDGAFRLLRDGEVYLREVELERPILHAPHQAFVNLREKCSLGCTFCSSPVAKEDMLSRIGPEGFADMIVRASERDGFEAVSITSAVGETVGGTVEEMAEVVRRVRARLPDVPIGVEPYVTEPGQLDVLKEAGVDEVKLNMTTWDRALFARVCPQMDYDRFLELLPRAVEVFGENKVMSNLLVGLGESDESLLEGVAWMADRGVVAYLRKLRVGPANEDRLLGRLGDLPEVPPERMVRLARAHARILAERGLDPARFETICFPCGACDVVPGRDVPLPDVGAAGESGASVASGASGPSDGALPVVN